MTINYKCPICGKEYKDLTMQEFYPLPKTMLYGSFKKTLPSGKIENLERIYRRVCSNECKEKNEKKYFIEEYKGKKIYCINGRYMPYLECNYWYDNIDTLKYAIDNKLIPVFALL